MSLNYIESYSDLIADMQKVLATQDSVHVGIEKLKSKSDAAIIANDLDLSFKYNTVDERFYFQKKLLSV